jgi:hypothetical protein
MTEYLEEVCKMEKFFNGFKVQCIPSLNNHETDYLAWIASSRAPTPLDIIIERLSKPSLKLVEPNKEVAEHDLMVIDEPEQELAYNWMHPIKMFIENQAPSDNNAEVECIVHKSKEYHLVDGILFQQGANGMMMKCI